METFGLHIPPFLSTRPILGSEFSQINWAHVSVFVVEFWLWFPFLLVVLLIGSRRISADVMDAARVDGATNTRVFWTIVFPLMVDWALWLWLLRFVDTLRAFDTYWVLFGNNGDVRSLSISVFSLAISRGYFTEGGQLALGAIIVSMFALTCVFAGSRWIRRRLGL